MGGDILFDIKLPEDIDDKEEKEELLTKRAKDLIVKSLIREFSPTKKEIDEIVKRDLLK